MIEKKVIQSVGFRNYGHNDEVQGFQFRVRLPYYRGIYLSQLMPGTLYVDDMKFDRKDLIWNFDGQDYSFEDLKVNRFKHWNVADLATIKVPLAGGLKTGFHDLTLGFCFTSSYMPPSIQDKLDPDKENDVFMPEFGHHVNKRTLIIV